MKTYKTYMPSRNNFKYKNFVENPTKGLQVISQNQESKDYVEEFYNDLTDAILDMEICNLYNFAIIPSSKNLFGVCFEFYPEILQTYDLCENMNMHTWLGTIYNVLYKLNRNKHTKYGINTQICKIFIGNEKNYDYNHNLILV
jgi:hypothetical protein